MHAHLDIFKWYCSFNLSTLCTDWLSDCHDWHFVMYWVSWLSDWLTVMTEWLSWLTDCHDWLTVMTDWLTVMTDWLTDCHDWLTVMTDWLSWLLWLTCNLSSFSAWATRFFLVIIISWVCINFRSIWATSAWVTLLQNTTFFLFQLFVYNYFTKLFTS